MNLLTPRELEIARLIADGLTYEEMGIRLGISARTVKAHTDRIRVKLGVSKKRHIPGVLRDLGVL